MAGLDSIPGLNIVDPNKKAADYGRWLIHGPQGSGKSTLASTIAQLGPTLFIDTIGEKGTRSFTGAGYADKIQIVRPTSIQAFDDLFYLLDSGNHEFVAVIIDSLTGLQKMTTRFVLGHSETAVREIRRGAAPASFQTWGQSLDIMSDTATFWYGLADGERKKPMHVIMTAQTKVQDDEISSERDRQRTPDVQRGALSIVLASPDYIVYTDEIDNDEYTGEPGQKDENGNLVSATKHIMRFGGHPGYRTKARIPVDLRGKLPSIIGAGKNPADLAQLSKVLRIGGTEASAKAK